jgi:flagellin
VQNRLRYTMQNLSTYQENLTARNSSIVGIDMALEMSTFNNLQILQQGVSAIPRRQTSCRRPC